MSLMDETCAGCGLPQSQWEGHDGHGYVMDGETYCCRGCAEGTGCTCEVQIGSSPR